MIKNYKRTVKDSLLREIKEIEIGGWISAIEPTKEEIALLAKNLEIELAILEDSLDINEISRVEKQNGNFYMIIRFPITEDSFVATVPLLVAITEQNILTLCRVKNDIIDAFEMKRVNFYTTQKTNFLLRIILEVFSAYDLYLNRIIKDIKLKKIKINNLSNKDILFLVQSEETLTNFVSSLVPITNLLEKILNGRYIEIYERDKDVVEDLMMDSRQTLELSNVNLKSIKNIREAYSAILTNELNKVIKLLTSLAIILTVPMIITSIYGMNVFLPLEKKPMTFSIILLIITAISALLAGLFVKKNGYSYS